MAALTIFVKPGCYQSEIVRYMLNEKGAEFRVIDVSDAKGEALCREVFGRVCAPALVDREVLLDEVDVIVEYVEDRYPHPAMLPSTPTSRAASRMFFRRFLRDFFPLMVKAEKQGCAESNAKLAAELKNLAPVFKSSQFFMSDELGLMDIGFAPIAYRLQRANANLGAHFNKYIAQMVGRQPFKDTFYAE